MRPKGGGSKVGSLVPGPPYRPCAACKTGLEMSATDGVQTSDLDFWIRIGSIGRTRFRHDGGRNESYITLVLNQADERRRSRRRLSDGNVLGSSEDLKQTAGPSTSRPSV